MRHPPLSPLFVFLDPFVPLSLQSLYLLLLLVAVVVVSVEQADGDSPPVTENKSHSNSRKYIKRERNTY